MPPKEPDPRKLGGFFVQRHAHPSDSAAHRKTCNDLRPIKKGGVMKSHRSASDVALIWVIVFVLLVSVGALAFKFLTEEDPDGVFGTRPATTQVAVQNRSTGTSSG